MPSQPSVENLALILLHRVKGPSSVFATYRLRDVLCKHGLDVHGLLGSHLLLLLAEAGSICNVQKVFDRFHVRNKCPWNALIKALIKCGESKHAISLYKTMQDGSPQLNVHTLVSLLKACAALRDFEGGCAVYAEIARKGLLEGDLFVGNTLIDMYAKWGLLASAQEVFDRLPSRDVVSWTSLIAAYSNLEFGEAALNCFEQMKLHGISPNALTYVCSLKACGSVGSKDKGREMHAEIERKGLFKSDGIVGNAVVDMYAKLGLLANAQEAFDKMRVRDVISWTALITGYAKYNFGMEALNNFEKMQSEGISPNEHTYVCILKSCGTLRFPDKGRELHAEINRKCLLGNSVIGSALVDMYAKCGLLTQAQDVHDKLPIRDVTTLNALITGYAKHNLGQEALDCFEQMKLDGFFPNAITYVSVLKACGNMKFITKGREVHDEIVKNVLLERDHVVGSALVDMYAKCGLLAKAQEVFDTLLTRDVIAWNALIAGYSSNNCGEEAMSCFERMHSEKVAPDAATFVSSLNACGSIKALNKGREIHAEIARRGLLEAVILVGNSLIDMYVKCSSLAKAEEVLYSLAVRDVVSWTTLIGGYTIEERGMEALLCFEQMQLEGIPPNAVTFGCILKACGLEGALEMGQELHAEAEEKGLLESSLVVGSAVVDMYAKCGWLEKAQEVFDLLGVRDVVTWNSLITGYAMHEQGKEALWIYDWLKLEGVSPNAVTFVSSLKACGNLEDDEKGQCIHADIDREGLLGKDLVVGNALVDMYSKCSSLIKAQEVFDNMPDRDVVTWNALIAGYVNHEQSKEALDLLEQMQTEGIIPDALTFASCLKACSNIGATERGEELCAQIARDSLLESDLIVGNALIDFYVKCGQLEKAHQMFDKIPVQNVISWNAVMSGYAQLGGHEDVFHMYERMREVGEKPDLVTFVNVLNACSHAGLVDKAEVYFETMTKEYSLSPTLEHYTCIIDLLCRSGHLDRAITMIERLPTNPDIVVWHTALDACQKWGSVDLGRKAFDHAVLLDARDAAAYTCMSNIYAIAGMLENAYQIEAMRVRNRAFMKSGDWSKACNNGVELLPHENNDIWETRACM